MDIRDSIEKQLGNLILSNIELSVMLKNKDNEIEKLLNQINELNAKLKHLNNTTGE